MTPRGEYAHRRHLSVATSGSSHHLHSWPVECMVQHVSCRIHGDAQLPPATQARPASRSIPPTSSLRPVSLALNRSHPTVVAAPMAQPPAMARSGRNSPEGSVRLVGLLPA